MTQHQKLDKILELSINNPDNQTINDMAKRQEQGYLYFEKHNKLSVLKTYGLIAVIFLQLTLVALVVRLCT